MARLTLITAFLLAGCASESAAVKVPMIQRTEPPAELLAAIPPPGAIFTAPDTSSVACLRAGFQNPHPMISPGETR